jgi:hypothetical protein
VLTGTCPDCQRVTTLVEGPLPMGTPAAGEGEELPSAAAPSPEPGGPECAECGSPLSVAARPDGSLEVSCPECETVTTFVPEGRAPSAGPSFEERRDDRPRRRDSGTPEGFRNARPCRQCGAPLTFTTDENGQLTGECSSCGNRFTLPPRRDAGGGGGDRGGGRYPPRGPPRYGRKPGGWSSGGGRRPGGGSGSYRRRDSDSRDRDDDERPRRRPRRE